MCFVYLVQITPTQSSSLKATLADNWVLSVMMVLAPLTSQLITMRLVDTSYCALTKTWVSDSVVR